MLESLDNFSREHDHLSKFASVNRLVFGKILESVRALGSCERLGMRVFRGCLNEKEIEREVGLHLTPII